MSRWLSGKQDAEHPQREAIKRLLQEYDSEDNTSAAVHNDPRRIVRIVGLVGLGEAVEWHGDGDVDMGEVELPFPVPQGCVALEARGDSMAPRVRNGEIVVVLKNGLTARDLIGREAIVKVQNGEYLLKTIRRGYQDGRFNLESFNAPLREDIAIEWVGELVAIIPSKRWVRLG